MNFLQKNTEQLHQLLNMEIPADKNAGRESAGFPKLTIITPSYNQAKFLERTIKSVINQGYPNLEYIIIDGGSTDESVEVIKKYEKYLTYWVSEKDRGQVHAINKALSMATGDYIAFQNSDDVYFAGTLQKFGEAAAKYHDDILFGDLYMIDMDDNVTELLKTTSYSLESQVLEGMQIHNQSLFFRRSLVEKYGLFDESYRFAFDYEFITRYTADKTASVRKVEGLGGALRVHPDAKSSTIATTIGREEHAKIKTYYLTRLNLNAVGKFRYLWCKFRKIAYFISRFDFGYISYRLSI